MEFPKRTKTHIAETSSWKILQQAMPSKWIVREVTERDYGIDCYLEIIWKNNEITGDLCSLQLKGCEALQWEKKVGKWGKKTRYSGIKKSTVNYWMNLPVPVFLMVAEISSGRLYFSPIKEQVRLQYSAYIDEHQTTLGFPLFSEFSMGSPKWEFLFFVHYLKERSFNEFSSYLTGLLIHWNDYYDFILENQDRDCFLEVEEDRQLLLIHIYKTCKFLAQFIGVEWKVMSLAEAYKNDRETWKDPYCGMHEMTLDKILRGLQPIFVDVLNGVRTLVVDRQHDYWIHTDLLLYQMCLNLQTNHLRKKC